ncbi:NAD-dependent epimerase/dehydratase family protein [Blastopirellula sp. JC732]|uniref:NAD-dependent epimerase/dehydratase family protein n=1 Tax=Blastopirellula sediminis TaxID=2894196 RepID=A0A9X1MLK5_9BACT|nr:NAD-dependent epimerase/dehydratase family protein [Blastopirellula sediminis]MCC9607424.1 NAD-dependent epimerase/dehydratase family protein [Blastopirellula sediminis]MCC9629283.1 NAD-dependent epimerase/dehydratase family protein [Blastopirellula sediminis]
MATYFVTGGSGFVGRHLCQRLAAEGHTLRCAVRKSSATAHLQELGAELIEVDLTAGGDLRSALEGCDGIFHSAGLISPRREEQLLRVNRDGTRFLCEAAAELPTPPPLIYVSSIAAAGPAKSDEPRRPADFPKPVSRYGESKRAGERQLEMVADRVPTTIVRPGIIFGEANRDMFPMFRSIRRFGVHAMPRADLRLSLIYVGDLIELLIQALAHGRRITHREDPQSKFDGVGYYFAADAEQPTYQALGEMVAEAVDVPRLRAITMPSPLVWTTATASELFGKAIGRPNILTRDKIREAIAGDWTCDISTAVDELGFQPAQSLQTGLCQTAQWYRAEGWL